MGKRFDSQELLGKRFELSVDSDSPQAFLAAFVVIVAFVEAVARVARLLP